MSELSDANLRFLRDRLSRLADVVDPDPARLGASGSEAKPDAESGTRPLPAAKLALGLLVVLAGIGAMVFLTGDGSPSGGEEPDGTGVVAARTPPPEADPGPVPVPERPVAAGPEKPTPAKEPFRPATVKPGVAMLLPALFTSPSQIRLERVWAVLEDQPRQVSAILLRLPNTKKEEHRIALLLALAGANGELEVRERLLAEMRGSGSAEVRRAAAAALGHVPGKDHPRVLAARGLSVRAGIIEDEAVREQLLDSASAERDPAVLGTLIRVLGPSRARDRAIDERLFELARSPSAGLRQAAIDGLRAGKGGDREVLGKLIDDSEIPAADRAKLVAAYARHEDSSETLSRLTALIDRAEDVEIREAAVQALGSVNTEEARRKAVAVLVNTGNDRQTRLAALGVVAGHGSEESRKTLRGIVSGDGDEAIRTAAKEFLRTIDPEKKGE